MSKLHLASFALVLSPALACAQEAPSGQALAERVIAASGGEAWSKVQEVRFTWAHAASGMARSYAWRVQDGQVLVSAARGEPVSIPAAGWEGEPPSDSEGALHKAFVNDAHWPLFVFCLIGEEGLGYDDLGEVEVPGFEDLGARRALRIRYGDTGGYTPGDHYLLYLGDDDLPVAWSFHQGGAEEPRLVSKWEAYEEHGGLKIPTRFVGPNDVVFIEATKLGAELADEAPASRPTSRPAGD